VNVSTAQRSVAALVVEDSSVLVERLREMLAGLEGVSLVDVVDTERAAVRALRDSDVDVVLLDLRLREGDGFAVLHEISRRMKRPTVVVLSNYSLPEYRNAALKMGAQYFLDKSHEMEDLPALLTKIIQQ
jgi:DNA-binding NarL/FixJ family response regulator